MDCEDSGASCSSCSSSSASSSTSNPAASPSCKWTSRRAAGPSPKRRAGRKKFRETRHPVYHGVRSRSGGKWVCEVREPRKKTRIWLGTFTTPESAALAHDVAAIALRGASTTHLNFPDSASALPRARSAAPDDVRRAAAEATEMFRRAPARPAPVVVVIGGGAEAGTSSSSLNTGPAKDGGGREHARRAPGPVFLDEEALFNMPALLEDMARGLLVTPPALQGGFDWDTLDDGGGHLDLPLWTTD